MYEPWGHVASCLSNAPVNVHVCDGQRHVHYFVGDGCATGLPTTHMQLDKRQH